MKPETHSEFEVSEVKSENGYSSYKNLGGIINEGEYKNALAEVPEKMKEFKAMSEMLIAQSQASSLMSPAQRADIERLSIQMTPVKIMAGVAGISLEADDALEKVVGTELGAVKFIKDPRAVLFTILRGHTDTAGEGNHHSQMNDQSLFVEALRMFGDQESFKKLDEAHPRMSFDYEEKPE
jgi:hypothetical protein